MFVSRARVQGFTFRPCLWCARTPCQNPHDCSGLVLWCGCVCRNMHTPCNLQRWSSAQAASSGSVCRERHCKMCLICSLYAHAFPKMLRIPALDHTTSLWGGVHRSFAPSLRVWCVSWVFEVRRFVNFKRVFIPRLKKFAENFWFWSKIDFFPLKIQYVAIFYCLGCLGWLVGWLDVIWYDF